VQPECDSLDEVTKIISASDNVALLIRIHWTSDSHGPPMSVVSGDVGIPLCSCQGIRRISVDDGAVYHYSLTTISGFDGL